MELDLFEQLKNSVTGMPWREIMCQEVRRVFEEKVMNSFYIIFSGNKVVVE